MGTCVEYFERHALVRRSAENTAAPLPLFLLRYPNELARALASINVVREQAAWAAFPCEEGRRPYARLYAH